MFCPNCGKDCGDAKFCCYCGTRLKESQANYTPDRVQRMPEQHLPKRTNTKKGSSDFPFNSSYIGIRSTYLDIHDSSITVSPTGGYRYRTMIPFEQLDKVVYMRPLLNGRSDGVLLFRGGVNRDLPVPEPRRMYSDNAVVIFPHEKDTLFYHVFQSLKTVAPYHARFEMIIPETKIRDLDTISQGIDLDYFWNMYAPYRERAASGICAKHGIKEETARVLVDTVFDERQRILYEADSTDAVRDLNLITSNLRREQERESRQEAERRERRRKDKIQETLDTIALFQMWDSRDD